MIGRMPNWSRVRERVAIDLLRWTPKGTLSRGIGWAARRRVPRPLRRALYGGFARYVGADLSRLDRPLDAFERFDDFFTRPLRDGARPIAEGDGVVVSPVRRRGLRSRASPRAAASSSARGATTPSRACSPTPPRRARSKAAPTRPSIWRRATTTASTPRRAASHRLSAHPGRVLPGQPDCRCATWPGSSRSTSGWSPTSTATSGAWRWSTVAATGVGYITVSLRPRGAHAPARQAGPARLGAALRVAAAVGARRRARHVPPRLDGDPALRAGPRAPRDRAGTGRCGSGERIGGAANQQREFAA